MKIAGSFPEGRFSTVPAPFYRVIDPPSPPLPGEELVGYMIFDAPDACLVPPCRQNMNGLGILQVVLLAIFFWPAMCIPCCIGCNYDGFQYPVYS